MVAGMTSLGQTGTRLSVSRRKINLPCLSVSESKPTVSLGSRKLFFSDIIANFLSVTKYYTQRELFWQVMERWDLSWW